MPRPCKMCGRRSTVVESKLPGYKKSICCVGCDVIILGPPQVVDRIWNSYDNPDLLNPDYKPGYVIKNKSRRFKNANRIQHNN